MALTINAKAVTADGSSPNAVSYYAPAKTLSWKDDFRLARTAPKPTSLFSGVARGQSKWVRSFTLTGALTTVHDGILDLSTSFPVGAASADIDSLINDYAAWVAHASFKTFIKNQIISY